MTEPDARLARAIQGKGAFRRFTDELHQQHPHLLPAWHAFRDTRAQHRAVDWLADNSLIDNDAATVKAGEVVRIGPAGGLAFGAGPRRCPGRAHALNPG
jgi:hypothetical protein